MTIINKKNAITLAISLVLIYLCVTLLGNHFTNINTYKGLIEVIDGKKNVVLGLTAASTAASNLISLIPGDVGEPLADKLADLSTWLMIILAVLYLEKFLLTVIGFGVFKFALPIAIIAYLVNTIFMKSKEINKMIIKIVLFCAALLLFVPTSVKVTQIIDSTYEEIKKTNMQETIEEEIVEELDIKEEIVVENEEEKQAGFFAQIGQFFSNATESVKETVGNTVSGITQATSNTIEKIKDKLNELIEATAIMLVTSCLIPILTLFLFLNIIKGLFGINIDIKETHDNLTNSIFKKKDKNKIENEVVVEAQ